MRPFEISILAFFIIALFIIPICKSTWIRFLFGIAFLLIFLPHTINEGLRWQMVLLYAASILFVILPAKFLSLHAVKLTFIFAASLSLLAAILVPVFKLPKPSGPYGIGYDILNSMYDENRKDFFTGEASREIVVEFYYPTDEKNAKSGRYIERETSLAPLAKLLHLPSFFFSHFSLVKINAQEYLPIARGVADLPILIFTPGRGGFRNHNLVMAQELVSRGYIVVCVDHPGSVAGVAVWNGVLDDGSELNNISIDKRMMGKINPRWDDEVTKFLATDLSFLIDEITKRKLETSPIDQAKHDSFWGHIDLNNIGLFGVSLGGMTTAQACSADKRIKACLMMDSYIPPSALKNGISQPIMFLTRPPSDMLAEKWPQDIVDLHQNTMHQIFENAPKDAYFMNINGAFHVNFSDAYLIVYEPLGRALGFFGKVDGVKTQKLISKYSLVFFDKYLKGKDEKALLHSQKGDDFELIAK